MIKDVKCKKCGEIVGQKEYVARGLGLSGWQLNTENEKGNDDKGYFVICPECESKRYIRTRVP